MQLFTTNTGIHILDSGGIDGRRWQKNQGKSFEDFMKEPEIQLNYLEDLKNNDTSKDINYTVSTFHYMYNTLCLDSFCNNFNLMSVKNWNSNSAYGLSTEGEEYITNAGYTIGKSWNSYNYESNLDYVLQGAPVYSDSDFEYPEYILIQIHLGADVRGGYTDAKLFKVNDDIYFDTNPQIYGVIDGIEVTTSYDNISLTTEDGKAIPVTNKSKINLTVM